MITRETKIGLLVGLAFILVVGILLSEHVTGVNDRRGAALQASGNDVRRAIEAPMAQRPSSPDVRVDPDPQPSETVVTRDTLDRPARPQWAPAGDPQRQPPHPYGGATEAGTVQGEEPTGTRLASGVVERARAYGEELVPLTGYQAPREEPTPAPQTQDQLHPQPAPAEQQPQRPAGATVPVREYVAVAGDSLNKLAGRFLGGNTPANRQAIIDLNPQLQSNPDRIIVGQKYLVPVRDRPARQARGTEKDDPKKPAEGRAEYVVYVVKAGDSLWKIAQRECGDAGKVELIKQLNADVLGDGETVKADMKLKLPKKKG